MIYLIPVSYLLKNSLGTGLFSRIGQTGDEMHAFYIVIDIFRRIRLVKFSFSLRFPWLLETKV